MGMARKAPAASYQRRFVVSAHAVERFRQRVDGEFQSRSNHDLANLLDERIVRHSEDHQIITDLAECDKPTIVYRVQNRNGAIYYAVVRDNTVVTVLDEQMLDWNISSGKWKRGGFNTPFAKVAQTLRGIVPEEPAEVAVIEANRKHEETDVTKQDRAPSRAEIGSLGADLSQRMLEYAVADQTVSEMQARIAELQAAMVPLVESRERAEHAVKTAQAALNSAIVNATRRTP